MVISIEQNCYIWGSINIARLLKCWRKNFSFGLEGKDVSYVWKKCFKIVNVKDLDYIFCDIKSVYPNFIIPATPLL